MKIQPVLTTEATEPGQAIQLKDGLPLVVVTDDSGQEKQVTWDFQRWADAHARTNAESASRRSVLESATAALGLQSDPRTEEGLKALTSRLEALRSDLEELVELRQAKAAGKLDDDADEKIRSIASKLRSDEIAALERQLADAKSAGSKAQSEATQAWQELASSQTREALVAFHRDYGKFRPNTLKSFLALAQVPTGDGFRLAPSGAKGKDGVPILHLVDDEGQVRKEADTLTPVSLESWVETDFRGLHSSLFDQPQGTELGGDFRPSGPGSWNDLSDQALEDAAARGL